MGWLRKFIRKIVAEELKDFDPCSKQIAFTGYVNAAALDVDGDFLIHSAPTERPATPNVVWCDGETLKLSK